MRDFLLYFSVGVLFGLLFSLWIRAARIATVEEETPNITMKGEMGSGWTYDTLKDALIRRGVEIKPRTKMVTLVKLWSEHKNDPICEPVVAQEEGSYVEPELPGVDAPAGDTAKLDLPSDIASLREALTKEYDGSDAQHDALVSVLADYGVKSVFQLDPSKAGEVFSKYMEAKGKLNA